MFLAFSIEFKFVFNFRISKNAELVLVFVFQYSNFWSGFEYQKDFWFFDIRIWQFTRSKEMSKLKNENPNKIVYMHIFQFTAVCFIPGMISCFFPKIPGDSIYLFLTSSQAWLTDRQFLGICTPERFDVTGDSYSSSRRVNCSDLDPILLYSLLVHGTEMVVCEAASCATVGRWVTLVPYRIWDPGSFNADRNYTQTGVPVE